MRNDVICNALLALSDPRLPMRAMPACDWPSDNWRQLFALADSHGVLGFVLHNVDRGIAAGCPGLGPDLPGLVRARQSWRAQLVRTLKLRQFGQQLLAALAAAEVPAVLLKGTDFADHLYPQPALRPTRDLDVFVPHERWPDAHGVLRQFGLRVAENHAGRSLTRHYGEQAWRREGGMSVDLHWNFVDKAVQRRRLRTAFEDWNWAQATQGGVTRPQPTPAIRLVIAALHAAVSHQFERLLHLSDLREACRQVAAASDLQPLRQTLERTRTHAVVAVALAVARRVLNDDSVAQLSAQLRCGRAASMATHLISLPVVLGPRRPARYVRRRLLREFLKFAA